MRPSNVLFALAPGASLLSDVRAEELLSGQLEAAAADAEGGAPPRPYLMLTDGVAAIPFLGCLSKYPSILRIFGVTDKPTLPELTAAVLAAGAAEEVRALFLLFDSPGGTAAGTPEAAAAVAAVAKRKPVHAYASDDCCSGALWIASQASRLSTNTIGHVGSVGAYSLLEDSSEAAAQEGLRFVLVSSGGVKGMGEPGLPLDDEYIDEIRSRVEAVNAEFLGGIAAGRRLSEEAVKAVANGHVFIGRQAVDAGLVDAVESIGESLSSLRAAMLAPAPASEQPPLEINPEQYEEEVSESPTEEKAMSKPNAEAPATPGLNDEESGILRRFIQAITGKNEEKAEAAPAAPILTADEIKAIAKAEIRAEMAGEAVNTDLRTVEGKATPGAIAKARPALLKAKTAGDEETYAAILGVLAEQDASYLLDGELASEELTSEGTSLAVSGRAEVLARNGIDAKREAELTRKYGLSKTVQ